MNWALLHFKIVSDNSQGTQVDWTVRINHPFGITVGRKSSINSHCFFDFNKNNKNSLLVGDGVKIGNDCRFTTVNQSDQIKIGSGTSIHGSCQFTGEVQIGDNCLLARNIFLSSYSHQFRLDPKLPIKEQDRLAREQGRNISEKIIIEDDSWIAWGAVITPGVKIAKGTIVAANAVVTKDTEPYGIYGGVPAKKLGSR
jgi:acetyltransferase-like isoleucine patch superfamily enzyme